MTSLSPLIKLLPPTLWTEHRIRIQSYGTVQSLIVHRTATKEDFSAVRSYAHYITIMHWNGDTSEQTLDPDSLLFVVSISLSEERLLPELRELEITGGSVPETAGVLEMPGQELRSLSAQCWSRCVPVLLSTVSRSQKLKALELSPCERVNDPDHNPIEPMEPVELFHSLAFIPTLRTLSIGSNDLHTCEIDVLGELALERLHLSFGRNDRLNVQSRSTERIGFKMLQTFSLEIMPELASRNTLALIEFMRAAPLTSISVETGECLQPAIFSGHLNAIASLSCARSLAELDRRCGIMHTPRCHFPLIDGLPHDMITSPLLRPLLRLPALKSLSIVCSYLQLYPGFLDTLAQALPGLVALQLVQSDHSDTVVHSQPSVLLSFAKHCPSLRALVLDIDVDPPQPNIELPQPVPSQSELKLLDIGQGRLDERVDGREVALFLKTLFPSLEVVSMVHNTYHESCSWDKVQAVLSGHRWTLLRQRKHLMTYFPGV